MGDITHSTNTGRLRAAAGVLGGFAGALVVAVSAYAYSIIGAPSGDAPFLSAGVQPVRRTATPEASAPAVASPAHVATPEARAVATPFIEVASAPPPPAALVPPPAAAAVVPTPAVAAATAPPVAAQAPAVSAPAPPPSATPTPAPAAVVATVPLNAREQGLIDAMNVRRASAGLSPLAASGALTGISRARSSDMLSNNYFSHSSPTGETWYSLLAARGLTFSAGGENLAKVYGDAPTSVSVAIEALMNSPTHRANILNPAYRLVGVGSASSGDTTTILTSVFTDR
jgi:uncharacterized protein YkwD